MTINWSPTDGMLDTWTATLDETSDLIIEAHENKNDWSYIISDVSDDELQAGNAASLEAITALAETYWENWNENQGMARHEPQWGDITAPNH